MAETYRKSKIENLILSLKVKKKVFQESLEYWDKSSIKADKDYLAMRIAKIELIDELLAEINKDFNLS